MDELDLFVPDIIKRELCNGDRGIFNINKLTIGDITHPDRDRLIRVIHITDTKHV